MICLDGITFLEMLFCTAGIIVWCTVIYKLYRWIERNKND